MGETKPGDATVNDTGVPVVNVLTPELRPGIDTDAVGNTVICSVVLPTLPEESVRVSRRVWVPTSLVVGVQVNVPFDELILELDTLLPFTESVTAYVGLVKPVDEIPNDTTEPAEMVVPGVAAGNIETLVAANAARGMAAIRPARTRVLPVRDQIVCFMMVVDYYE